MNLKKEEKERAKQITSLENEIEKLQAEVNKPPPENLVTEEKLKDEIKQLNLERNALGSRIEDFNLEMSECVNQNAAAKAEYDMAERRWSDFPYALDIVLIFILFRLQELDNVDVQRLQAMERWDKDTYDAIIWVRNNKDLFKMEVFETPYMRLSVKEKRYANAVEACFNANQLKVIPSLFSSEECSIYIWSKTFVVQCKEDVDTLNRINDGDALGRKARITTWFRPYIYQELIPPPLSPEEVRSSDDFILWYHKFNIYQMQQQHFDGYALDYVECPDALKFFLMKDLNLHRVVSILG